MNDDYPHPLDAQGIRDILSFPPSNPPRPGGRCLPYYYPEKGDEKTWMVDHDPNKRYYVLGLAHCGGGIFTSAARANRETNGFSGYQRKAVKTWEEAEQVWRGFHDDLHGNGCPDFTLPPGFAAPTPVHFGMSLRTAVASYLPLVSPSVCSPPPCPSTFRPWSPLRCAPPSPKIARSRPPVTPQPGTQPAPGLGSPFSSPSIPSSVSPSPLRPVRSPSSFPAPFPTISPLADLGITPPPPILYRSPMYSHTSPTAPPSTASSHRHRRASSSSLSRVSDILTDISSVSSGFLSDMELPSTTASPRSSPRTLSAIDMDDDDDEYAAAFVGADDEICAPRLMWAVKGLRYGSWDDPRDAVAAAQAHGMGSMFTLISSVDELELASMHNWGAVASTHPAASSSA
ncbi:hypothetical protein R3P38DRAFT_3173786 [Favolaschia claudopus]|uniref:Uncharacterized protein n=1 Tax=Favolaschia claudopus TaxID=2862362 RepID=A0AAW0DH77_9AGAR